MARQLNICGFETGDQAGWNVTLSSSNAVVGDGTARSGDFFLRMAYPAGIASTNSSSFRLVMPAYLTPSTAFRVKMRGFVRVWEYPSVNDTGLITYGQATARIGFGLSSAGELTAIGQLSSDSVVSGIVMPLGLWHRVEVDIYIPEWASPWAYANTVNVTLANGETWSGTADGSTSSSAASSTWGMHLGAVFNNNTTNFQFDFDDLVILLATDEDAATLALPTGTRITAMPPVGQGAAAAWTGDWRAARKRPNFSSSEAQTSATNNARTLFRHATTDELGLEAYEP